MACKITAFAEQHIVVIFFVVVFAYLRRNLSPYVADPELHTTRITVDRQARTAGGMAHLTSVIVEHLQRRKALRSWLSNNPLGDQAIRNLFYAVGKSRDCRFGSIVLAAVCEH